MNTRKYPRTLEEAFGPYTSRHIDDGRAPMDWQDRLVLAASAICVVALAIIMVVEVLK